MKRFIRKTLYTCLPLFILLIGVNYFGDSFSLFDNPALKISAQALNSGNGITDITMIDERRLQKYVVDEMQQAPDILVLGSSKARQISSEMFEGQTLFNSSVMGATLEDLIAIYELYKVENKLPKKMIIGLQAWTFNYVKSEVKWMSLYEEYMLFHDGASYDESAAVMRYKRYLDLLSPFNFQKSIGHLFNKTIGRGGPTVTSKRENQRITMLRDGSWVYGAQYRNIDANQADDLAKEYLLLNRKNISIADSLTPDKKRIFRRWIEQLKAEGIEFEFFLGPYHPLVQAEVEKTYPNFALAEEYVRSIANELGIEVHGSYDPGKLGLSSEDFYDGSHFKAAVVEDILAGSKLR